MNFRILLVLVSILASATVVSAQSNRPGYTDYSDVSPDVIESNDLIEALSPPRGYSLAKMPPPSVASPIFFEFGRAELTPASEQFVRVKLAPALASLELESFDFAIEGHTDNIGSAVANEQLSLRRAEAVRSVLASTGIPDSRLQVVGRGETSPRRTNETATGRNRNRRVEVVNQGASRS